MKHYLHRNDRIIFEHLRTNYYTKFYSNLKGFLISPFSWTFVS
jgi:hypothetical protein